MTAAAQEQSRPETAHRAGKSDEVQPRHAPRPRFYPTRGRVAQNERDKERDEEAERGV